MNLSLKYTEETIDFGIVVINSDYSINMINNKIISMFGYSKDELITQPIEILFTAKEYKMLHGYMKKTNNFKNILSLKKYNLLGFCKNKTNIPLVITIIKSDSHRSHLYIIIKNITESEESMQKLKYLAYYDQLTNLPNRSLFLDRAKTAIHQGLREKGNLAIIYMDINKFKVINDTLGHEGGNILLKEFSHRLMHCVRDSDTVSRLGGDEFAILMNRTASLKDASLLIERILEFNKLPINIYENAIIAKMSFGISIFPQDGDTIEILLENADMAMYYAKDQGNNKFVYYSPSMKK